MDYMHQIHRMLRPEELQRDLDDYNRPVQQQNRSIDDCLDTTDALVQWAQRKAPQYDPENRRPIPGPNDSPMSDYDIEFTRLNKTDQGLSSLSSLNIPTASNTSLSVLNNVTPRANALNRKSSMIPKRSGNYTPSLIIRHKQALHIDLAGRQSQNQKDSLGGGTFRPSICSTPILSQRRKSSIFEELAGPEQAQGGNEPIDSTPNPRNDTLTNKQNTPIPPDRTYQKNQESQVDESELTLVPAPRPVNGSVIAETQDNQVPEAQQENAERDVSVSNGRTSIRHDTHTINRNTLTPTDRTYRKMTQGSQIDGSDLVLVPATQPSQSNESLISEDEDIPETQEEQTPTTERNDSILYTPTRSQRKKSSIYSNIADAETSQNNRMDSVSNARASIRHDTHTINANTLTPKDRTYRKSTQSQINKSRSILVPETQPADDSVIPETQDDQIPETQDDQISETQDDQIAESQEVRIPETQEEQMQETEQNVSVSANARASVRHDTLTSNRNTSIPANKSKRNPVVLLSPLTEEIRQKYKTKRSTVPMDLVITPPKNFQNSRRASQLENDDLIAEASPQTCALRKQSLSQQNFDQFSQTLPRKLDADQSQATPKSAASNIRKRGRRKSENPELTRLANISTNSNRQSLTPAKLRARRLASFDALRNDDNCDYDDNDGGGGGVIVNHDVDIEQDIVVTPATSTSDQAKSTAGENVFKVPEIPARRKSVRKSKADNSKSNESQTNDSIANGNADKNTSVVDTDSAPAVNENENASTSRRTSHDSFDFSVHIEPMDDNELQDYMPQDDTTPSNPSPTKSNTKSKGQKSKASANTAASRTKSKRVQNTIDTDNVQTLPRRRPSRDSHRNNFIAGYLSLLDPKLSLVPSKSVSTQVPKQKSKVKAQVTAPVTTKRRIEMGPPKKKLRTEPGIQHETAPSTSVKATGGKSMASSKTKSKPNESSSTSMISNSTKSSSKPTTSIKLKSNSNKPSSSKAAPIKDELANFIIGMDEKRLNEEQYWKDINDYEKGNDIQQEDVLYIKTKEGKIEAATHNQIEYVEIDDVKYGFVPSANKRYGMMRFKAGAKKASEKSAGIIYLFVMQGCFEIHDGDGKIQVQALSETTIPKGVFYEITNIGKKTGVIQFEYTE